MKLSEVKYTRPDIEGLKNGIEAELTKMSTIDNYEDYKSSFLRCNEMIKEVNNMATIVSIRYSQDTRDKFYEDEQEFFDSNSPLIKDCSTNLSNTLLDSKFRNELEKEFGKQYFDLAEKARKTFDEELIPLMQEINALGSEYQKTNAQILIEFEGKKYNMSGLGPLLQNPDRAYRKRVSKARSNELSKYRDKHDEIYDKMVKLRTESAKKKGYDSFVQMGYDIMSRTCYDASDIEKYRGYILKYVTPKVHQLKKKIAENLGIDQLYQYDTLTFKDGNPTPKTSPEQMIADAQVMYNEMSKETGEFFNQLQDNGMLDLLNREGKSPGGYCTYVGSLNLPFIFSNFNGTSHDVDVLTHEAGHAFQCYSSMHFPLEAYYFPTYEAAEIHSMSMEFFAWDWVDKFFKEDTAKYKLNHLLSSLSFLPYGATVDEFQHYVYENPTDSPEDRRAKWSEIQGKYMTWSEIDDDEYLSSGTRWQVQSHIFQMPFYYIDYTLAQLCAFQFHRKMSDNFENAWADYHKLCKQGGSLNFLELVDVANLKSPFDEEGFKSTIDYIFGEIENHFDNFNSKSQTA